MNKKNKEIFAQIGIEFSIILFCVSYVSKSLVSAFALSLSFLIFFFIPSLILLNNYKNVEFIERFMFANILGFSYGSIYFILDVLLKIPLTKIVFLLITCIIIGMGLILKNSK